VIGAGPAGLIAAEIAAHAGARVTVYDRMRLPGRKFLLAGRGGLNLTHSEPLDNFLMRYREGGDGLAVHLHAFPPVALRAWADGLGAQTFVGSSGRVFPRAMKASPLLRAWLQRLSALGVHHRGGATLTAIDETGVMVEENGVASGITADAIILALGGASWPELGADGRWTRLLAGCGVEISPLVASNVGVAIDWPDSVTALAGQSLKHVAVLAGDRRFPGEVMLTASGLEGQAIYGAGAALRAAFAADIPIALDLQPNRSEADLAARLSARDRKRSLGAFLQQSCGLSPPGARIVQALCERRDAEGLAAAIKRCLLTIKGFAPIAHAISTAGGVAWASVNDDLSLKALPHVFVCGEMLDWDAPTGGYLLQACFSTGVAASRGALARICDDETVMATL
jgi:uncharacterized flavoprotein (TIGR03862 family)